MIADTIDVCKSATSIVERKNSKQLNLDDIAIGAAAIFGHDEPRLALPDMVMPDLRSVDWPRLCSLGFKGVMFDKDNTLTIPYALQLWPLLPPPSPSTSSPSNPATSSSSATPPVCSSMTPMGPRTRFLRSGSPFPCFSMVIMIFLCLLICCVCGLTLTDFLIIGIRLV